MIFVNTLGIVFLLFFGFFAMGAEIVNFVENEGKDHGADYINIGVFVRKNAAGSN